MHCCEERASEIKYYDILFYPMEIIHDKFIHSGFFSAVVHEVELLDVLPEAQPASGVASVILGDRFNNHFVLIPFPEDGRKRNAT